MKSFVIYVQLYLILKVDFNMSRFCLKFYQDLSCSNFFFFPQLSPTGKKYITGDCFTLESFGLLSLVLWHSLSGEHEAFAGQALSADHCADVGPEAISVLSVSFFPPQHWLEEERGKAQRISTRSSQYCRKFTHTHAPPPTERLTCIRVRGLHLKVLKH